MNRENHTSLELLTFEQAAHELGLDQLAYKTPQEVVRNLCRTRRLRHVKIGKRVFVRRKWLAEYVERESVAPLTKSKT